MKKFLLFLSALFVGVSFATAQTYEISTVNGTLNEVSGKSSVWTANDSSVGLKITATDSNGNPVNAITAVNSLCKFYAIGQFPGTENSSSSPTTYTISVDEGYLITGYSMTYYPSSGKKVTLSNEYGYSETPVSTSLDYYMTATGLSTKSTTFTVAGTSASYAAITLAFTVTVEKVGEGSEEPGDDSAIMEQYAAIEKPTFVQAGNTTFVKAATLAGDVNTEVAGIQAVAGQACVTNVIEVAAGAEFDLNITYKLNWGDLAIYQIENGESTKEYGYYYGSWEPNGSTANVAQNIANEGISITEVVDEVCTVTYPIAITENHNPGDVIVVRAITGKINNATNSAFEQNIVEGGYVDFLFVVTEETAEKSYTLTVGETEWATLFLDFNAAIPEDVKAYTVTAVNDGYVTLTQVTGVLPAKTGIIVKAAEGNYTFSYAAEATANVEGNLLEGTVTDKNIEGEAYVLGKVDGVIGLYKAKMTDGVWLNNANKAYLPASVVPAAAQGAASFSFRFGEGTTGIDEMTEQRAESKEIYDLTGRRVEAITAPGIYIVNGKKVLVK